MPANHRHTSYLIGALFFSLLLAAPPSIAQDDLDGLRQQLYSENDNERLESRQLAAKIGARAIPVLVQAISSGKREPSITARHALTRVVHHAGRPDAAKEERPAVLRQLEAVVSNGKSSLYLRRECLWLIGFLGGDKTSVDVAAEQLNDEDRHVAEIARLVLERMPGEIAKKEILDAIREAKSDDQRADLIFSLAKRGDRSVAGFVLEFVRSEHAKVRFSAFEALARLGAHEGVAPLRKAIENKEDPQRQKLVNEYLRLADHLFESKNDGRSRVRAREMYAWVVSNAPADFQRERALHRLSPVGDDSAVAALIVGLNDEAKRVRRLAIRRLAVLKGDRVSQAMIDGFATSRAENRPILLRAIAERDAVKAKALIERSKASEDVELKIVAHDLAGDLAQPALEGTYLEVAKNGSEAVREVATRGYIAVAEKRLSSNEKARAYAMFDGALGFAREPALRSRALRGLVSAGDATKIGKLASYLDDPVLSVDAANGFIVYAKQIADGGDKDNAEKHLMRIATGQLPREVISSAATELRRIGRDPQAPAIRQGFLLDWWLTGPIEDTGGGLAKAFEPESKIDLTKPWQIGARRFRWRKIPDLTLDGKVNLMTAFRRGSNVIAYAYAELESDTDRDVVFKIGSDDGCAFFVNGKRVHIHAEARGVSVDQDIVPAKLKKGKNRLLLKIQQGGGDWGFVVRLTKPDGEPLILGN